MVQCEEKMAELQAELQAFKSQVQELFFFSLFIFLACQFYVNALHCLRGVMCDKHS